MSTNEPETSPSVPAAGQSSSTERAAWDKWVATIIKTRNATAEKEMADLTSAKPPASLTHYGFNEYGTWGLCPGCNFQVTLDEDGFIAEHARRNGSWDSNDCRGSRKEPIHQTSFEMHPSSHITLPPSEDGND